MSLSVNQRRNGFVAFNNADQQRELRIPLADTPVQRAAAIELLLGEARAELAKGEIA